MNSLDPIYEAGRITWNRLVIGNPSVAGSKRLIPYCPPTHMSLFRSRKIVIALSEIKLLGSSGLCR